MKIIVGLGNPGPRYETTRHNAGFLAIDRLIEKWQAVGPKKQSSGLTYSAQAPSGEKVLLVKPETFMNLSGQCVGPLAELFKIEPTDLIVLHDEIDLPALTLRIKTGGGTGGHNGIKSIDQALGTAGGAQRTGYHRVRIGVGHPARLEPPRAQSPADYVLERFTDAELGQLDGLLDQVVEAVDLLVRGEALQAMNRFNTKQQLGV